jgi:nitric oxide reductase activation protein
MSNVPDYLIDKYNQIAPPLISISKQLQKRVSQKLQDRRKGGKDTNLYFGHKIEARTLIRNDGRHFYKNKLPNNEPQMCVAVLLDESGSMSCGDRETYARATGLILYDFCNGLKIPVTVYGHTADIKKRGSLEMNSYAEFNSIDKKDRYRIMDSCARDNNRDGAALKYMFEMLDKRAENIKILFVISDGQPYASGYSGFSAEEDMKTMVDTYKKRGITTIAAAIGSDKPSIERIYGQDGFLDITDLNKLPVILTNILIKNLKL